MSKRKRFHWKHPTQILQEQKSMRRIYELNIHIQDNSEHTDVVCKISKGSGDGAHDVQMIGNGRLTGDEMAMLGIINETLARIVNGKTVNYEPDPLSFLAQDETIKCEWLRSGNLKIHGPDERQYRYCTTIEAALEEHRTFTVPRKLVNLIPKTKLLT